jgi:hypothetical protein
MSVSTLPVSARPQFPQGLNSVIPPSICCHVTPETSWGAGDAFECNQLAVVHHVATEMDYCAAHWKVVGRG